MSGAPVTNTRAPGATRRSELAPVLRAYGIAAGAIVVLQFLARPDSVHPGDVLLDALRGPLAPGWVRIALVCSAAALLGIVYRRGWTRCLGCAAVAAWFASGCATAGLRVT